MPVKKSVSDRRRARMARRSPAVSDSFSPGAASALPTGLAGDVGGLDDLLEQDSTQPGQTGMEGSGTVPSQVTEEPLPEGTPAPSAAPVDIRSGMRGSVKIPDQRPDESFNSFRVRVLGAVRGVMQTFASSPDRPVVLPVSPAVAALVGAWCAAGCPDDFSISHPALTSAPGGGVLSLLPGQDGNWNLSPTPAPSGPGIFLLVRESPEGRAGGDRQSLRADLISAVQSRDFARAKEIASRASAAGMSDSDLSDAIDEALPDEIGAGDLSPAELLAVVSAASPERRAKLLPVLQSLFSRDPEFLSGEGRHPLRSHLGRLGVR